jgi:hypothetical protein
MLISQALTTIIERGFVAVALVLSVTWKVTEVGPPAVVGVPEITPLELSDSPADKVPEAIVQVYGVVPPVAARVCEEATPTVQDGNELVVILGDALIVIERGLVAVALVLSVTWKVTEVGPPAVVGVPEITPLERSDSPAGKVPEAIVQA